MLKREEPIAIYMEGALNVNIGKMGHGVLRYSPNPIACVIDSTFAGRNSEAVTGIPRSTPVVGTIADAKALGAQAVVLGIAPPGGLIPAPCDNACVIPVSSSAPMGTSKVPAHDTSFRNVAFLRDSGITSVAVREVFLIFKPSTVVCNGNGVGAQEDKANPKTPTCTIRRMLPIDLPSIFVLRLGLCQK